MFLDLCVQYDNEPPRRFFPIGDQSESSIDIIVQVLGRRFPDWTFSKKSLDEYTDVERFKRKESYFADWGITGEIKELVISLGGDLKTEETRRLVNLRETTLALLQKMQQYLETSPLNSTNQDELIEYLVGIEVPAGPKLPQFPAGDHYRRTYQELQKDKLNAAEVSSSVEPEARERAVQKTGASPAIDDAPPRPKNRSHIPNSELLKRIGLKSGELLRQAAIKAGLGVGEGRPKRGQRNFEWSASSLLLLANMRVKMGCKEPEKQAWREILAEFHLPPLGSKPKAKSK